MVISSIDIKDGKVVQLRQGKELVLQRDDAAALAAEFNRYGEVAVIDLDAAMGNAHNAEIINPLLRIAECRVGGGIKTVEQAAMLVSLGAKKIITGSATFRTEGGFSLNAEFLNELANKIGRRRIVVAVDARLGNNGYEIVVDGWKTTTKLSLIETAKCAAKFAGELLFTCVEREGTMSGINLQVVKELRAAVGNDCLVTVAGGVAALDEVSAIAKLGCDVQLGMALYTGKINLADSFIECLNWEKVTHNGAMFPVIAQSYDGEVLMTGYADREAIAETFKRGKLCFHSRSRNKLWMKGETSGNTMQLLNLRADCDRDALLATVIPSGPVCHTGAYSCFHTNRRYTLHYLLDIIKDRLANSPAGSYTASLTDERVRRKINEEAYEVITAGTRDNLVWEIGDLLYHLAVLMGKEGIALDEVLAELERRHVVK